jgi:hypothetical protein
MSNLKQLADAIAKLHKTEWELTSLRHDLQRQYEVLERQEASVLELDIPEDEILATLVKDFPVEVNSSPGRSTVTIHNISISKPTATEALVLIYKVLKFRGSI